MPKIIVREQENNTAVPALYKAQQRTVQHPGISSQVQTAALCMLSQLFPDPTPSDYLLSHAN